MIMENTPRQRRLRTWHFVAATSLLAVGAGLLIAGFCVEPPGEIHSSVLIAFGEILTFVGSIFGFSYNFRLRQ